MVRQPVIFSPVSFLDAFAKDRFDPFLSLASLRSADSADSVLDTELSDYRLFWIPAFAGMTAWGLVTSSSFLEEAAKRAISSLED
jgi:hypothetical protein